MGVIPGKVRHGLHFSHGFHRILGVIVLVRAQRDPLGPLECIHKVNGCLPLRGTGGLGYNGIHDQTPTVLLQYVAKSDTAPVV